jgi:hypothetical protein
MSGLFLQAKETWNDVVVGTIFDENATLVDLVKLAFVLAAIVFLSFEFLNPTFSMLAKGPLQNTMRKIASLEFKRPGRLEEMKGWGFEIVTEDEYYELVVEMWPGSMTTGLQHIIGGIFSTPSVLGMAVYSASVRSSLACLGILVELGFEIQDTFRILYQRLFMAEAGKKKYPNIVVLIFMFHHSLTCVMGLPMILNYRELPYLHRLCFDLQFAGGLMLVLPEFTRTLDVSKRNELKTFLVVSFFMLVLVVWTRLFDWFYIVYKLLQIFYADEKWTFLVVGTPVLLAFSVFNALFCVIPTWQRFFKFLKKLKKLDSLPETADEHTRKSTIDDLQIAAADFASIETNPREFLVSLFEERHVERRHTFNSAELSRSAALAAAAAEASNRRLGLNRQQSMVAWRGLPSRVKKRAETKLD